MDCDPWAALIPVEHGVGCVVRVQVGIADAWQAVGMVGAVLVLVGLFALVVSQARR